MVRLLLGMMPISIAATTVATITTVTTVTDVATAAIIIIIIDNTDRAVIIVVAVVTGVATAAVAAAANDDAIVAATIAAAAATSGKGRRCRSRRDAVAGYRGCSRHRGTVGRRYNGMATATGIVPNRNTRRLANVLTVHRFRSDVTVGDYMSGRTPTGHRLDAGVGTNY